MGWLFGTGIQKGQPTPCLLLIALPPPRGKPAIIRLELNWTFALCTNALAASQRTALSLSLHSVPSGRGVQALNFLFVGWFPWQLLSVYVCARPLPFLLT